MDLGAGLSWKATEVTIVLIQIICILAQGRSFSSASSGRATRGLATASYSGTPRVGDCDTPSGRVARGQAALLLTLGPRGVAR